MKKNSASPQQHTQPFPSPKEVIDRARELGVTVDYMLDVYALKRATPQASQQEVTQVRQAVHKEKTIRTNRDSDYGQNGGEEPDWTKVRKQCPMCDKMKFVLPVKTGWGLRKHVNGRRYPQARCNECRKDSAKESYEKQRDGR